VLIVARVNYDPIVHPCLSEDLKADGAARKLLRSFLVFVRVGAKVGDNELREERLKLPQTIEFNFSLLSPLYST